MDRKASETSAFHCNGHFPADKRNEMMNRATSKVSHLSFSHDLVEKLTKDQDLSSVILVRSHSAPFLPGFSNRQSR